MSRRSSEAGLAPPESAAHDAAPRVMARTALACVVAFAALWLLWGIGHGLPFSYFSDEDHFVKRALAFGSGDLNPHWFHKPALYMYVLFAAYGALFAGGWIAGAWDSTTAFAAQFVNDPGAFFLVGRLITAAFAVATVWLVYACGRRHSGVPAGVLAALLLALSSGIVISGQYALADVPTMFFTTAAFYFLLRFTDTPRLPWLALAAAAAGLGTATKYYPIVMLFPLLLAALWGGRRAGGYDARRAGVLALAAIGAFWGAYFIGAPYNFLDPLGRHETFRWLDRLGEAVLGGARERPDDFIVRQTTLGRAAWKYVAALLRQDGLGPAIGLLALVGLGRAFVRRGIANWLILGFIASFAGLSILLFPGYPEARHQLTLYPLLALLAGSALQDLARRSASFRRAAPYLLAFLLLQPVVYLAGRAESVSLPDTRNEAKAWIEANLPAGAKMLADENGPPLRMCRERLLELVERARQADPRGQFTAHFGTFVDIQLASVEGRVCYDLHEIRVAWWRDSEPPGVHFVSTDYDRDMANPLKPVGVESLDYYERTGFEYAVVHSGAYRRFSAGKRDAAKRPAYHDLYAALFERAEPVAVFRGDGRIMNGPTVYVLRIGKPPGQRWSPVGFKAAG
ncbi:MAG: glycosyltransferase family 39 protein [Acidobacteria bacterium]|nr:glycosyltransferase family 39 protein [Acidobacteriota bacterium]